MTAHRKKAGCIYPTKKYPHFDKIIRFSEVESYVSNTKMVEKHSFFPLVHYIKVAHRYKPEYVDENETDLHKQHIKNKPRDIMYAAHVDAYIYRYYADQLNAAYDRMAGKRHIDAVAIAYRDNKRKLSNIQFAADVFTFIAAHPSCYIRVGDFKDFFGSLNHRYLKKKVKQVLQTKSLTQDWYKVVRSVTQYTYIDKKVVAPYYDKRSKCYFKNIKNYRQFRKNHPDKFVHNEKECGIPQGTALSGVLANVYMVDIDEKIQQLVQSHNGLYRRYSDDTIIVIPTSGNDDVDNNFINYLNDRIEEWIGEAKLSEQMDKTREFQYREHALYDKKSDKQCVMDYLGFNFDGEIVKVRQKCIYKFERKANFAITHAAAVKGACQFSDLPFRPSILRYYFPKGHRPNSQKPQTSFLTYMDRVGEEYKQKSIPCEPEKQIHHLQHKLKRMYNNSITK